MTDYSPGRNIAVVCLINRLHRDLICHALRAVPLLRIETLGDQWTAADLWIALAHACNDLHPDATVTLIGESEVHSDSYHRLLSEFPGLRILSINSNGRSLQVMKQSVDCEQAVTNFSEIAAIVSECKK